MASVNKVIIVGNLGRDPEMSSSPYATFQSSRTVERVDVFCEQAFYKALFENLLSLRNIENICGCEPAIFEHTTDWYEAFFGLLVSIPAPKRVKPRQSFDCSHAGSVSTRLQRTQKYKPCGGFYSASKANLRNAP